MFLCELLHFFSENYTHAYDNLPNYAINQCLSAISKVNGSKCYNNFVQIAITVLFAICRKIVYNGMDYYTDNVRS